MFFEIALGSAVNNRWRCVFIKILTTVFNTTKYLIFSIRIVNEMISILYIQITLSNCSMTTSPFFSLSNTWFSYLAVDKMAELPKTSVLQVLWNTCSVKTFSGKRKIVQKCRLWLESYSRTFFLLFFAASKWKLTVFAIPFLKFL